MRQTKITLLKGALLTLTIPVVSAASGIRVSDGETVSIDISSTALTRIAVTGNTGIAKIWQTEGLEVKADKESGDIYVRPKDPAVKYLSFFLKDTTGSTYLIRAGVSDRPAGTVILEPSVDAGDGQYNTGGGGSLPWVKKIKNLHRALALGKPLRGFTPVMRDKKVPLWEGVLLTLHRSWVSRDVLAEVYYLKNTSDRKVVLHESEIQKAAFNKNRIVHSVALSGHTVAPGASVNVWQLVRNTNGIRAGDLRKTQSGSSGEKRTKGERR